MGRLSVMAAIAVSLLLVGCSDDADDSESDETSESADSTAAPSEGPSAPDAENTPDADSDDPDAEFLAACNESRETFVASASAGTQSESVAAVLHLDAAQLEITQFTETSTTVEGGQLGFGTSGEWEWYCAYDPTTGEASWGWFNESVTIDGRTGTDPVG